VCSRYLAMCSGLPTNNVQLGDTMVLHDVEGRRHLHYCIDLSWTGTIADPAEYSDLSHFRANTTRNFNEQLLGMLQEIVSKE
jgi:hypothetical protein